MLLARHLVTRAHAGAVGGQRLRRIGRRRRQHLATTGCARRADARARCTAAIALPVARLNAVEAAAAVLRDLARQAVAWDAQALARLLVALRGCAHLAGGADRASARDAAARSAARSSSAAAITDPGDLRLTARRVRTVPVALARRVRAVAVLGRRADLLALRAGAVRPALVVAVAGLVTFLPAAIPVGTIGARLARLRATDGGGRQGGASGD